MLSLIISIIRSECFSIFLLGFLISILYHSTHWYRSSFWPLSIVAFAPALQENSTPAMGTSQEPLPVYFLGIGGPNFMENVEHPAYAKLTEIGQEITTKVKPKAVVVFSAHWQAEGNRIEINTAEKTDIIYDFQGFPPHYYEYEYPYEGSPEVAEKVIEKFSTAAIEIKRVRRGLDHGVWAGFIVGK
jgi:4,5-DOPA dioxygenase extradiol